MYRKDKHYVQHSCSLKQQENARLLVTNSQQLSLQTMNSEQVCRGVL